MVRVQIGNLLKNSYTEVVNVWRDAAVIWMMTSPRKLKLNLHYDENEMSPVVTFPIAVIKYMTRSNLRECPRDTPSPPLHGCCRWRWHDCMTLFEDTAHFGHRIWRNQVGTDREASFLLSSCGMGLCQMLGAGWGESTVRHAHGCSSGVDVIGATRLLPA